MRTKKTRTAPPGKLERPTIPLGLAIRMFVVGAFAVAASAWAIQRHYARERPPLVSPAPPPDEIPAPELIEE
jgi:hypothetical protein